MEAADLLKKVRKVEIKTKGLTRHIFSGEYHSAFKGRGMSFSEVRPYQWGDDVRNIDWNVTARTGHPYVKIFEEERELTVMLMVDMSRSAFFGTVQFKQEMMVELSAVLAFSAIQNNDKVGLILFGERVEKYIPPKKGRSHILRIIRELINYEPSAQGTNLRLALEYLNNVIKKRCITFLISDFIATGYEQVLQIVAKKHDLVGMHIYDPAEQKLPQVGLVRMKDAETGYETVVDTSSTVVKKHLEDWFLKYRLQAKNIFLRNGADLILLGTHESYVKALMKFFKRRMK